MKKNNLILFVGLLLFISYGISKSGFEFSKLFEDLGQSVSTPSEDDQVDRPSKSLLDLVSPIKEEIDPSEKKYALKLSDLYKDMAKVLENTDQINSLQSFITFNRNTLKAFTKVHDIPILGIGSKIDEGLITYLGGNPRDGINPLPLNGDTRKKTIEYLNAVSYILQE